MMTRLLRAALFLFLSAASVFAQSGWKIAETRREASPNESVEHWTTTVEETATADRATLHLAVFATRTATLRVIDQPSAPRADLASAMSRINALAGVNGGYFDPEDAPVGLLVSEGRVLSPSRKAKLLTGVLCTTQNQVDIVRTTHFTMTKKVKAAVQCGPLLIERGAPVPGLNDTRPARRTFAAVDGEGHALIGVSSADTRAAEPDFAPAKSRRENENQPRTQPRWWIFDRILVRRERRTIFDFRIKNGARLRGCCAALKSVGFDRDFQFAFSSERIRAICDGSCGRSVASSTTAGTFTARSEARRCIFSRSLSGSA